MQTVKARLSIEKPYLTRYLFSLLSQNLILLSKSDFRKAGLIIYVALDTFPRFDFLTDFHIDERGKIKEDERPHAIFVIPYTGTLRPVSLPIASFQGATFYCRNITSEHHRALK